MASGKIFGFTSLDNSARSSQMSFNAKLSLHTSNRIVRIGRLCWAIVSIKINSATSLSAHDISNYFPVGFRPASDCVFVADTGLGDGKAQPVNMLYTDGVLRVYPSNLNKVTYAIGSAFYICEDY